MIPIDLPPRVEAPVACVARALSEGDRPASLGSVVSGRYPLRVHWARDGDEPIAQEYIGHLERAWEVQVDALGFRAPVLPDDAHGPELDLYLAPVGPWEGWVEATTLDDDTPDDGYFGVPTFIVIDQDLPADWRARYAAHEFNHVLQFAMAANEPSLAFWEGTAVAAQKWTLGEAGTWHDEVRYFQEAPFAPVLAGDSYVLWDDFGVGWLYEYGAALWVLHVDEVLGDGDGRAGAALWREAADDAGTRDVYDAVRSVSGQSLGDFLAGVAATRWLTGDRWSSAGLADAATWGADEAVPVAHALTARDLPAAVAFTDEPMITGQQFVTLDLRRVRGEVSVHVATAPDEEAALTVLGEGPDGWSPLDATSGPAPTLTVDVGDLSHLAVAVTHLGPDAWDDPWSRAQLTLHVDAQRAPCTCRSTRAPAGWSMLLAGLLWVRVRRRAAEATPPRSEGAPDRNRESS